MTPHSQGSDRRSTAAQLGELGEALVAAWLIQEGWMIEARRWRCRAGELDLVARSGQELAFVEVKTRSPGNWDRNGALAITPAKQLKLLRTAELFLIQHPQWAHLARRFDVALVGRSARGTVAGVEGSVIRPVTGSMERSNPQLNLKLPHELPHELTNEFITLGDPILFQGQALVLWDYWPGAIEFDG
jgi:putative endonuclease